MTQNDWKVPTLQFRRYDEIAVSVDAMAALNPFPSNTSYSRSRTIVDDDAHQQTICQATCCAKQVLYSMGHEERQLLNTMDGLDLADVMLRHKPFPPGAKHLEFAGALFHPDLLPCVQPGTIFHLNNKFYILDYFWKHVRPKLKVPFVLITSDSDRDSPLKYQRQDFGHYLNDTLLLKWYGTNPTLLRDQVQTNKFEPMMLGLSKKYPQSKYLEAYLAMNRFGNPFAAAAAAASTNRKRIGKDTTIDLARNVFVNFGTKRGDRLVTHRDLCVAIRNASSFSYYSSRFDLRCNKTARVSPHQIYQQASQFQFGISPPGLGWDCFRTYELLYLGVIPVIELRHPQGPRLFQGLPVVHVPRTKRKKALADNDDILAAMQDFVQQQDNLSAPGWNRLFLAHWRRKIFKDAGRPTIHHNDGNEYYVGWKYELTSSSSAQQEGFYCAFGDACSRSEPQDKDGGSFSLDD